MSMPRTVAEVLSEHVSLQVECIDRMYLNLYIPMLQTEGGTAHFFTKHRGNRFASSALMAPMSRKFVSDIEAFARREGIDLVRFHRKQRKEDLAKKYLQRFPAEEGVLFIGKAQEKTRAMRTERRYNTETGAPYPSLCKTTSIVNQYYFYALDRDFGPFFIKFSSYFPYNGKVVINGHEYAKRQLERRGIAYKALDNGVLECADPTALQRICDGLVAKKIDRLVRKWFARLPHPFPASDRAAGYRYLISILQAEFSLTQVLDRPATGRVFFEQVIRDNLDLGRPDRVGLIFNRRVRRDTPGRFRTRVVTQGVTPSLRCDYKHSHIKQYHKEEQALRTETTINDTYDFKIGRQLHNLPALRKVGFAANRRLLDVQRISHDCSIGEDSFNRIHQPVTVDGQRGSALRFGDRRALALLSALVMYRHLPRGFTNQHLREHIAQLLGLPPGHFTQCKMTYDLRRLRLHAMIERIPGSHRYAVTDFGFRAALTITRIYNRLFQPALAVAQAQAPPTPTHLGKALDKVDEAVQRAWQLQDIAA
ncbi:MAG: hypothetical protein OXU20_36550 [Myxococcales bacterium]|nr:hypothetical protein [Myxococcales bacterium]